MNVLMRIASAALVLAATSARAETTIFPLQEVISEIKKELVAAQNTPGGGTALKLDSVELNLVLSDATDGSGGLSVGVPEIGAEMGGSAKASSEKVSTIYVSLKPPKPLAVMGAVTAGDLGLTRVIVETRKELQKAMVDEPVLTPEKVRIEIRFALSKSGGPSGKFHFFVVSADAAATWSASRTNTITLNFSKGAP